MVAKNSDLHGMVPDKCAVALLLLDVINDLEFEDAELLRRFIPEMGERISSLLTRCREAEIPVIYVNDNFGRWRSDFRHLIAHCRRQGCAGKELTELLLPREDDYFILKPKHSGFFATSLEVLLRYLQVETLILVGVAGNICVLFTANDAFIRDYHLVVPRDCIASNTEEQNAGALKEMEQVLHADTTPSTELDLAKLKQRTSATDE
jgi:nicotinamidase-related amidase